MTRYMLDTNIVSHLLRSHPRVTRRLVKTQMSAVCISSITKGELLFGLAKRQNAKSLHTLVSEFLNRIEVLPWDSVTAEQYGPVRAEMERKGKLLGPLDMLIAAHALAVKVTLVSSDKTFRQVAGLRIEDWTV